MNRRLTIIDRHAVDAGGAVLDALAEALLPRLVSRLAAMATAAERLDTFLGLASATGMTSCGVCVDQIPLGQACGTYPSQCNAGCQPLPVPCAGNANCSPPSGASCISGPEPGGGLPSPAWPVRRLLRRELRATRARVSSVARASPATSRRPCVPPSRARAGTARAEAIAAAASCATRPGTAVNHSL